MQKDGVSIFCLAYNHERYIRKCLDGFVMQRCNFEFEVLIHDDASTDNTQSIIREYEAKYPKIIKPIYQVENTFKKTGQFPDIKYNFPRAQYKYIAFCEGDDFWTDPTKLQKQYDAMESRPDCNFCCHIVKTVKENGDPSDEVYPKPEYALKTGVLTPEEFLTVECSENYSFQTTSYFLRYDNYKEYVELNPRFKQVAVSGDTPIMLYFASTGNIFFINEPMSCYRRGSVASIERGKAFLGKEKLLQRYSKQAEMMREYDKFTNGRFHKLCERKENALYFWAYWLYGDFKMMAKCKYRFFMKRIPFKTRLKFYLSAYFPKMMKKYNDRKK